MGLFLFCCFKVFVFLKTFDLSLVLLIYYFKLLCRSGTKITIMHKTNLY